MSILKKPFKKLKRWNSRGKNSIGNTNCNDPLENFINVKNIKCYEYSDFKLVQSMDRGFYLVRGNLNDDCFVLKSFSNDDKTIEKVVYEVIYYMF
jgi:hypothetical protein